MRIIINNSLENNSLMNVIYILEHYKTTKAEKPLKPFLPLAPRVFGRYVVLNLLERFPQYFCGFSLSPRQQLLHVIPEWLWCSDIWVLWGPNSLLHDSLFLSFFLIGVVFHSRKSDAVGWVVGNLYACSHLLNLPSFRHVFREERLSTPT